MSNKRNTILGDTFINFKTLSWRKWKMTLIMLSCRLVCEGISLVCRSSRNHTVQNRGCCKLSGGFVIGMWLGVDMQQESILHLLMWSNATQSSLKFILGCHICVTINGGPMWHGIQKQESFWIENIYTLNFSCWRSSFELLLLHWVCMMPLLSLPLRAWFKMV